MTRHSHRGTAIVVAVVVMLGALSAWLQAARDRVSPPASDETTLYLSARSAGRLAFTHRSLLSDLYWIRTIQYFGGRATAIQAGDRKASFDLLYPLLDITTTLDPKFSIAYRFGAIFLSEQYPHGPGRPDLAIALLEKGLKANPGKWEFWEDIGFVYYWSGHDYRKASEAFRQGAELPGAPWWLKSLAATMLVRGGDRTTSRLLWQQLYETANNEYARDAALKKLRQLQAIEEIERLEAALRGGAVLRGVPRDPTGKPYVINGSHVEVSTDSSLFPLPAEPGSGGGR